MAAACKLDIVIPESHKVELDLPADLPTGPAEVIVVSAARPINPEVKKAGTSQRTLADRFAGRVGLIDSGGQGDLSQDGGEKLADHLEAKRRAGHL